MTTHEHAVLDAMEQLGGSFVSRLAKAWRYADAFNHKKLKDTFGDYWEEYERAVEMRAKIAEAEEKLPAEEGT